VSEKGVVCLRLTFLFSGCNWPSGHGEVAGAGVVIYGDRESIWRSPVFLVVTVGVAAASNYATQMSRCQHN